MATDTQNPLSHNPESENPKNALNLTLINPTEESKNLPSTVPQSENNTADKNEANGSKAQETTQAPNSVASPTGDGAANNDIQKKMRRAERFGVPIQLSEQEKRNSRAERFGTAACMASEASNKIAEEQKRKARAERFGLSVPSDDEAKKKARLNRFGSGSKIESLEEEKRKARGIRFSQSSSNKVPHISHEGEVEQKTAMAGNATGRA